MHPHVLEVVGAHVLKGEQVQGIMVIDGIADVLDDAALVIARLFGRLRQGHYPIHVRARNLDSVQNKSM